MFHWCAQLSQGVYSNFSINAKPLIELTKKFAKFKLNKECPTALDFPKDNLTTVPTTVLVYPDISNMTTRC